MRLRFPTASTRLRKRLIHGSRGCMTLVLQSVSHGNRGCRTDVQEHHRTLHASPGSTCQPVRDGSATVVCFPAFAQRVSNLGVFLLLNLDMGIAWV
jgi:hypothetical protein